MIKILILDTDDTHRDSVKAALSKENYTVFATAEVPEALRWIEEEAFDISLCDFDLPGESGLEFSHELRRRQPRLSTVIMSRGNLTGEMVAAILADGNMIIGKPVNFGELMHLIRLIR